jgi:hypothetical protein
MRILVATLLALVTIGAERTRARQSTQPDSPGTLLVDLANAKVPAGMILSEAALQLRAGSTNAPVERGERLRALIANRAAAFRVPLSPEREVGVWHFRAADAPADVIERVTRPVRLSAPVDATLATVLYKLVSGALMEREVGGVVGTGAFGDGCRLDSRVRVAEGASTVSTILDAAVQQVPGVVWFVAYPSRGVDASRADADRLTIGVVCTGGENVRVVLNDLP